jgi:hypothetical protein
MLVSTLLLGVDKTCFGSKSNAMPDPQLSTWMIKIKINTNKHKWPLSGLKAYQESPSNSG